LGAFPKKGDFDRGKKFGLKGLCLDVQKSFAAKDIGFFRFSKYGALVEESPLGF